MTELVEFSVSNSVAVLTLNRPEVRNAINDAMRGELLAAIERAAADDAIRALVLTGKGKSFCSGGDHPKSVSRSIAISLVPWRMSERRAYIARRRHSALAPGAYRSMKSRNRAAAPR